MIKSYMSDINRLIGLTVNATDKILLDVFKGEITEIRIVEEDGVPFMTKCDYLPTRVNVAVKDGVITEIVSIA